jgi:hypothetical protein
MRKKSGQWAAGSWQMADGRWQMADGSGKIRYLAAAPVWRIFRLAVPAQTTMFCYLTNNTNHPHLPITPP